MKVKLLTDHTTPEHWISNESKKADGLFFPAGTVVNVIPAGNMPDDSHIRFWIDEPAVEDHCYGIAVFEGDYEVLAGWRDEEGNPLPAV